MWRLNSRSQTTARIENGYKCTIIEEYKDDKGNLKTIFAEGFGRNLVEAQKRAKEVLNEIKSKIRVQNQWFLNPKKKNKK
jgi:hypothetical protein